MYNHVHALHHMLPICSFLSFSFFCSFVLVIFNRYTRFCSICKALYNNPNLLVFQLRSIYSGILCSTTKFSVCVKNKSIMYVVLYSNKSGMFYGFTSRKNHVKINYFLATSKACFIFTGCILKYYL